ncbi:MAG: hypothetical protein AABX93_03075 [Nanoarchaeota archaeon]
MRFRYNLYPEALKKLESEGIKRRVEEAIDEGKISIGGFYSNEDVHFMVKEMGEKKVFDYLPKDEEEDFKRKISDLSKNLEQHSWQINRFNGERINENVELEDIIGMLGWHSHLALRPEEVFDYKKFGFENLTDLTGSVTALANNLLLRNLHKGYIWEFKTDEGKTFMNEITGSEHADLRIYKTDITPYETIDPLENKVSYRPEIRSDLQVVAAYHSTEEVFLASLLKWNEQCNIKAKTLDNKAKEAIEWAKSLGQGGGFTTEHFFGAPYELRTKMAFNFGIPLPILNEDGVVEDTSYGLVANSDSYYGIYTGPKSELIITREPRNEKSSSPEKEIAAKFMPEEADHLIKGILYQSAKGLGRTSAAQLVSMLEYRFSERYKTDLKEFSPNRKS